MTKLSNLLTVDLGQALLKTGVDFFQLTGGVDNLGTAIRNLSPVLITGTGLLSAYAVAALKGATANAAFASSFAGVSAGLLLGAGAATSGDFLGDQLLKQIQAPQLEFDRLAKDSIEQLKAQANERLSAQSEADGKRVENALKSVRELNRAYLADVSNAERAGKLLLKNAERITGDIVKSREDLAEAIRRSSEDSVRFAQQSAGRILGLQDRKEDRQFADSTKGLSDAQKVFALNSRSAEIATRAATELQRAAASGDQDAISRALGLFDKAQATSEIAQSIAERTDNRALEARAAKTLTAITDQQIAAEKNLQALQGKRQGALDSLTKKQTAILDSVREQTEIARENSRILSTDGGLLQPLEIKKRKAELSKALDEISKSGFSAVDLKLFDEAGIGNLAREFNLKLAQQGIELTFSVEGEITRIQSLLRDSFTRFKLPLPFDANELEAVIGRTLGTPDDVAKALGEVPAKADALRKAFAQVPQDDANIQRLRTSILGIAAASDTAHRAALRFAGPIGATSEQRAAVANIRKEFELLTRSGSVTTQQITALFQKIANLGDAALSGDVAKNLGLATDFTEFTRAIGLLKELEAVQQRRAANPALAPGAQQQLQQLESLLQKSNDASVKLSTIGSALSSAAAPATMLANEMQRTQFGASGIASGIAEANAQAQLLTSLAMSAAQAFQSAASAAASIKAPSAGADTAKTAAKGVISLFAKGGFARYFADGGFARGVDTIPAMLAKGESVINAKSTQRFFTQLQAMNAGQRPIFRGDGGVSTNVGDVTINVHGAQNPRATGREVMAQFRRELRRGTGRL